MPTEKASSRGWNPFGSVFTILGILMGTASLISLTQRWTGVEIVSEIARDALPIYRQMMEQLKLAVFDWWMPLDLPWSTFSMPEWGIHVIAVWVLCAASFVRFEGTAFDIRRGRTGAEMLPAMFTLTFALPAMAIFALQLWPLFLIWLVGATAWSFARRSRDLWSEVFVSANETELSADRKQRIQNRKDRAQAEQTRAVENWRRLGYRAWVAASAPWVATLSFFLWNAIQLTPQ